MSRPPRLLALDVFRGLAVMAMMMVDWPGSWDAPRLALFEHAHWTGVAPPDFIFPAFVVAMGLAIPLALGEVTPTAALHLRILRRGLILIACGLFLNLLYMLPGPFDFSKFRLPGVLQRYGLVYPLAAELYLFFPRRIPVIAAALLLGYWALTALVPVPGFGHPDLWRFPEGETTPNLVAWLDHAVLGRHVYEYPFDPEGLLGTIPTLASALIGVWAGEEWRRPQPRLERIFAAGTALLAGGYLWGQAYPLCKKVWSGSFALLTAGFSLLAVAALVRATQRRAPSLPLAYGRNPLLAIVGFTVIDGLTATIPVGHGTHLKDALFRGLCALLPVTHASWVYSVIGVVLFGLVLRALDRRGLYLRA